MKKLQQEIMLVAGSLSTRRGRLIILALTIALFVIAAGAPNATIGIGK